MQTPSHIQQPPPPPHTHTHTQEHAVVIPLPVVSIHSITACNGAVHSPSNLRVVSRLVKYLEDNDNLRPQLIVCDPEPSCGAAAGEHRTSGVGEEKTSRSFSTQVRQPAYTANCSRTRHQNGVTGQQNVGTAFASQLLVTYSPAGSPANRELFTTRGSWSVSRLVARASRGVSTNGYANTSQEPPSPGPSLISARSSSAVPATQTQVSREMNRERSVPEILFALVRFLQRLVPPPAAE
ncbi:hypothetical protein PR048_029340 [Dryococelus australis]|uniref:Uncharacterized protein n=1 Tax=Dryococelus australis TaxID=614101 RepID=A0ABQ9GD30_9NEOP|nr:hypothetical protein PR048_029340 [Dryococelus australis]